MYCTRCGVELQENYCYCFSCGTPTEKAPKPVPPEPLMRTVYDRKIAGVCGGFAKYLQMDVTLMRFLWIVVTIGIFPVGILGYIAAWILMPSEPVRVYTEATMPPGAQPCV